LRRRYAPRREVTIVAAGLADRADSFSLFVPSYNGFLYDGLASFDRAAASRWLSSETLYGFDPARLRIEEIGCRVETLDSQGLDPIFVKIDVQGFEYQVLLGARATLKRSEPMLLVENVRADSRLIRLTEELGYEEFHYDDGRLKPGPSAGENSFLLTERRRGSLRLGDAA